MVMQGRVFVSERVKETKLRLDYVYFPGQKGPSTRLFGGFSCFELHSTDLETRGVCVCVHSVCMLTLSPLLWTQNNLPRPAQFPPPRYTVCFLQQSSSVASIALSSCFHYIKQHCALANCLHLMFHFGGKLLLCLALQSLQSKQYCIISSTKCTFKKVWVVWQNIQCVNYDWFPVVMGMLVLFSPCESVCHHGNIWSWRHLL